MPQLKNNGFEVKGVDIHQRLPDIEKLDIMDKDAVFEMVERHNPGYIFCLSAPRARSEIMRNYKLDLIGLNLMPHWEKSLEENIRLNKDR
jgi:hypothetical protein